MIENRGKRIGIIAANDHPYWGGSEDLWIAAAFELLKAGADVEVSLPGFARDFGNIRGLETAGARLTFRDYERWNPLWRWRYRKEGDAGFYRWIDRVAADLYLISQGDNYDGNHWADECLARGRPYVLLSQLTREWAWLRNDRFERAVRVYNNAKEALFVSRHSLTLTECQLGRPLPNGAVVANPYRVPRTARPAWPVDDGVFRLACLARLDVAAKGQDVLMEIFSSPKWRARPIRVSLYGDGLNRRSLERLRTYLGAEQVELRGFTKSPEETWASHHAAIMPSRQEGLPLSLVEAMHCGRFGIVSDVGGNAELIEDGRNGFVAAGWQRDLFEEALERAWEIRERWESIGSAAWHSVRASVPEHPAKVFADRITRLVDEGRSS